MWRRRADGMGSVWIVFFNYYYTVVCYLLQWHNLTEIIRKIRNLGTFSWRENPKDYYY